MAVGDVWHFDVLREGKPHNLGMDFEVGLPKGHYVFLAKADFNHWPASGPPGGVPPYFGYVELRVAQSRAATLETLDASTVSAGWDLSFFSGTAVAQGAFTAKTPAEHGPARVLCSLGASGMTISSGKLIVMQVNRRDTTAPILLTKPASKLNKYKSPDEIVAELKTKIVG